MKHVVTVSELCQTVLVTGFGAFPGAPQNPTAKVVQRLERHRARLRRLGIELRTLVLPVVYRDIEPRLRAAVDATRPAAILHLGLASRRRAISVEMRAVNRAGPLHPDAARCLPARQRLAPGGAEIVRATFPAEAIHAALRRGGHDANLSIEAGDYVCNATLYASLVCAMAPRIGFIHVPRVQRRVPIARGRARRPSLDALTAAALTAILIMGRRPRQAGL